MTDEAPVMPMGYVHHEESIKTARATYSASADVRGIDGEAKKTGKAYFNLLSYEAAYLAKDQASAGGRKLIDLGDDGTIFEPLGQETGTCNGCSHGEVGTEGWFAKYTRTGTGPIPQRCSFAWAYLVSRDSQYVGRGDSGGIPSLTVAAYHDVGVLPVNDTPLFNLKPHGKDSEEAIAIQYRDDPKTWISTMEARAKGNACRVSHPSDAWGVADCITTLRPVSFGSTMQAREVAPGSNGVSPLYQLKDSWGRPAGHETFADGWFVLGGRLGFIKKESWWNVLYPGSKWPNHRVVVQTDDGPKVLYPGQCAIWADEWMSYGPECWAIDTPGSR